MNYELLHYVTPCTGRWRTMESHCFLAMLELGQELKRKWWNVEIIYMAANCLVLGSQKWNADVFLKWLSCLTVGTHNKNYDEWGQTKQSCLLVLNDYFLENLFGMDNIYLHWICASLFVLIPVIAVFLLENDKCL